ncbi:MAG: HAD family hydrolase [Deltaproteobacteria bacterium]
MKTVFLDVGNTLVTIDFELIAERLATRGFQVTPAALIAAEAAARPGISRRIAAGGSTEGEDSFTFYIQSIFARLEDAALGGDVATDFARSLKAEVATPRLWSRRIPGVREALGELAYLGIQLVAVSNSDGTAEQSLVRAGLRESFALVADSALVGCEKPDPGIFEWALAQSGAARETTVHLGDVYAADIVGARAAGIAAILVDPTDGFAGADCARCPDLAAFALALRCQRVAAEAGLQGHA